MSGRFSRRIPRTREAWIEGHVPGEPGFWVLIGGDLCVFAVMFVLFAVAHHKQPPLFARSQRDLHLTFGAVNTLLLLTSSLSVVAAVRTVRAGHRHGPKLVLFAMVCGVVFLINKGLEWSDLIRHHHTPAANEFFTYFFVLTGIHALHVVIGLLVLSAIFVLSRKETLTEGQQAFVEGGACFWHLVDLLWVVLFALLYLAR